MTATASGAKVVVYNTRERLISTDHNREQAFGAQALAEALRWILDPVLDEDVSGNGLEVMGTGSEAYLRGTILSGLRFRPDVGTTHSFVEAGAALLIDNGGHGSDDSIASFVSDAGVQTIGTLELTPGAGSTRIDVVEFQRVTSVTETDSRDIFNPATGLFSPVSVTKVQQGALTYRIRLGTPGAGFPGTANGWLPIAVCSVPVAAGSWDAVTVWDVRPLAADRTSGPFASSRLVQWSRRSLAFCDATTAAAQPRVWSEVDLTFGGYRAGGLIRKSSTVFYIDPTDATHQQAGFAFGTTGALWHCYLVFPFGLPRWVRYSDAAAGARRPSAQRGIPTISSQVAAFDGSPYSGTVQTPAGYGLQDPAGFNAVLAFCGRGPQTPSTNPIGMHCDGKMWAFVNPDTRTYGPGTNTTAILRWTLDSSIVPGTARAIYVRLHGEFQFPTPAVGGEGVGQIDGLVTISDLAGNNASQAPVGVEGETLTEVDSNQGTPNPGVLFFRTFVVRVPLQPYTWPIPSQGALRTFLLTWTHNCGIVPSSPTLTVVGWELGP